MRLLNTSTLHLHEFLEWPFPKYAILSHTWGEEEILFSDIEGSKKAWMKKKGATKVTGLCRMAAEHGLDWVWIDTCCIDKSNSTELSEAINSMFEWYVRSYTCYVYLADVEDTSYPLREFTASRWFMRGWTLQELIAPRMIEFYDANWDEIGTKSSLRRVIADITQIDEGVLTQTTKLLEIPASVKMSWSSKRRTTRPEDEAYSLLGIFGVNMPLLYGEGTNAFVRLQEEILKVTEDHSLFAHNDLSLLARGTDAFARNAFWELPSSKLPQTDPAVQAWIPSWETPQHKVVENVFREDRETLSHVRFTGYNIAADEPPKPTARGMRMMLPVNECLDDKYLLAFIHCLCSPGGELICLALEEESQDEYAKRGIRLIPAGEISLKYQLMYVTDGSRTKQTARSSTGARAVLLYHAIGSEPILAWNQTFLSSFHLKLGYELSRFHVLVGAFDEQPWVLLISDQDLHDTIDQASRANQSGLILSITQLASQLANGRGGFDSVVDKPERRLASELLDGLVVSDRARLELPGGQVVHCLIRRYPRSGHNRLEGLGRKAQQLVDGAASVALFKIWVKSDSPSRKLELLEASEHSGEEVIRVKRSRGRPRKLSVNKTKCIRR